MPLVARPRVERRIREAATHAALTVLHAPVGAGKTSAVSLALEGMPNVVWLDVKPWHSGTFARAIIDKVRTVRDGFGRITLGALASGSSAAHLGQTFARELAHIDQDLTIVLDNVQLYEDRDRFFRFVDAALSEIPDRVRIVAIGRSLPQAPLFRSFARKRIAILEPDVLVLDRDELRAFAAAFGAADDDGALQQLADETEGWAAGVVLALTTRGVAFKAAARHVLSEIGKDHLGFLEETAV